MYLSQKSNIFGGFTHLNVLWKFFESFVVASQQVSLYWKTNDLISVEQVLRTSPISLRRHWASWRNWLWETTTLVWTSHRGGESTIVLLLCFSKDPWSNALVARNIGCPLSRKWSIINSAEQFHKPFGLQVFVPHHVSSVCSWSEDWPVSFRKSSCAHLNF